jgi:hypothetical protein
VHESDNLKAFQKLCGPDFPHNIAVVTTMRGTISDDFGQKRDAEIQSNDSPFEPLFDGGAQLMHHNNGFISASAIMTKLLSLTPIQLLVHLPLFPTSRCYYAFQSRVKAQSTWEVLDLYARDLSKRVRYPSYLFVMLPPYILSTL